MDGILNNVLLSKRRFRVLVELSISVLTTAAVNYHSSQIRQMACHCWLLRPALLVTMTDYIAIKFELDFLSWDAFDDAMTSSASVTLKSQFYQVLVKTKELTNRIMSGDI